MPKMLKSRTAENLEEDRFVDIDDFLLLIDGLLRVLTEVAPRLRAEALRGATRKFPPGKARVLTEFLAKRLATMSRAPQEMIEIGGFEIASKPSLQAYVISKVIESPSSPVAGGSHAKKGQFARGPFAKGRSENVDLPTEEPRSKKKNRGRPPTIPGLTETLGRTVKG
jgi:hypothetical protein